MRRKILPMNHKIIFFLVFLFWPTGMNHNGIWKKIFFFQENSCFGDKVPCWIRHWVFIDWILHEMYWKVNAKRERERERGGGGGGGGNRETERQTSEKGMSFRMIWTMQREMQTEREKGILEHKEKSSWVGETN